MTKRNYDLSQKYDYRSYDFARSNGVDPKREVAIDKLFDTKLGDFMEQLNDQDKQDVFDLIDKVLENN